MGVDSRAKFGKGVSAFITKDARVQGDPHEADSVAETGKVIQG